MYSDEEVPGGAAGDPPPGSRGRPGEQRPDHVTYNFYGTVDARGSRFGDSLDCRCSDWRVRRPTGVLRDVEVAATVSNYVPPSTFRDAVACLRRDHLVVLAGAPGSGRRAGALALLREVTDGVLVVLSPAETARDLASRTFLGAHGYLVIDSDGMGSPGTDPAWAEVAARVRASGSYLVVATTPTCGQGGPATVPYLAWNPPPAAEVLRGHLAGSWAEDDVDRLVEFLTGRVPARRALRWLACLARLVNAGKDPAQALADLAELEGSTVDRWFSQPRTTQELAKAAVAAFLTGATERTVRSQLAQLKRVLQDHQPAGQARPSWTIGNRLLRIRRIASPASACPADSFKDLSHRRFALARIWGTAPSWFLAAVREWINAAATGTEQLAIASGLALLATSNFDRVESEFLEPWSRGRIGQLGQVSAAYVLWYMCRDESTAPLALRTGIRWSRSKDADQRATAVLALSGELGACYPTDAARRLYQLIQAGDVPAVDAAALGRLFAILVDQTHQAGMILTMLDAHGYRSGAIPGDSCATQLTVDAVRSVLVARSYRTGRPAVAELLRTEPEWLAVVARLLARLLRDRTARQDGTAALWDVLHALPHLSSAPIAEAFRFGQALASALTSVERSQLRMDLIRLDMWLRPTRAGTDSPAATLAVCLAAVAVSG